MYFIILFVLLFLFLFYLSYYWTCWVGNNYKYNDSFKYDRGPGIGNNDTLF